MKHSAIGWACVGLLAMTSQWAQSYEQLPANRNIYVGVANDAGARYGSGADDTYWINAPGGGLNQLHIANSGAAGNVSGQVTTQTISTSSTSGSFWVTTTGGRGYNDDIVLAFSMTGPVPSDFSLSIKSSGYQWDAGTSLPSTLTYVSGAVNETFTSADLRYGPNAAKPGPGDGWTLPFWSGEDITNPANQQVLMFVDLNLGNTSDRGAIDAGSVRVDFQISGLYDTHASFNAYAFAMAANIADASINWTNRVSTNAADVGQSGYSIISTAQPVPEPATAALALVGLGLVGLLSNKRRKAS
ncbi:PEP-CTERM sorting domain-containing protein [Paucibacter sp. R3-3]|uniref:PEP-CTERM sorting domain-containing protein n=1 Tax=Roseateles agri TaxID=3098619 RepID=A0ABU5DQU1_9BURK|nr:PEP-CTERM sorting domain-containing protein [Paucibacter sp. R3-3]MDY0748678.1 PEP-CTERM sorting domain-containing protein [Paucibacter sp. R3-3]